MIIGFVYDLKKDYLDEGFSKEDAAEFDSEETINAIHAAIERLGYTCERVGNCKALAKALAEGKRWDMVFNIAEGLGGRCRESYVPAMLDMYQIPYTFSDAMVCAMTLDKSMAKRIVAQAGLPTPPFFVVNKPRDIADVCLEYPLFAKPLDEGTGKGIDQNSKIDTPQQLEMVCLELLSAYGHPVLVEEYLPGREFTVGILGNDRDVRAIGSMEIKMTACDKPAIYSYTNKDEYEKRVTYDRVTEPVLKQQIETLAIDCYKALQCRDSGRVDLRCDKNGIPCFIEINPLAGLNPIHSDMCIIARNEGISYERLIGEILNNAFARTKTGVLKCQEAS